MVQLNSGANIFNIAKKCGEFFHKHAPASFW